ncbi:hypothetical protein Acid345_1589 [Candidatus Koribacter versatilis Ellin345]|uniref:Uncharacterized protein n=1 Tax=Koribacter versatilis (strain Ellin345) TaxID=204669 RepID=Q1IRA9_KORVE|nr:hypothetical protein [Candidatus Koribacter versatilis]ABF40591.1 hypothetical protein Acid345_1589 [Candidatus Koribacter versatilis Ellin345]
MKKLVPLALLALATSVCVSAQQQTQSQSLGDVARQQKSTDKAHKVWTNDDFPDRPPTADTATSSDAAATDATAATADTGKDAAAGKDAKADSKDAKKPDTVDEQKKIDEEWKGKLDAQKQRIADLQREYDLNERELKLAQTTYYADAGNKLRDQKDFLDKDKASREKLDTLKQQISDEQTKLTDMQDKAHKAGANKAYD